MRPLTLRRLLWTCGGLSALLLACVVLALKLGAVPISVTELLLDLGRIAIGRANELPTEYRLIVFDLRLPRIMLGIWWARRFRFRAQVFRRCCGIRWPIPTFWEFPAARLSGRFWRSSLRRSLP